MHLKINNSQIKKQQQEHIIYLLITSQLSNNKCIFINKHFQMQMKIFIIDF